MCWVARYHYPVGVRDTVHQCAIAGKYGQRGGYLPGVPSAAQARVRLALLPTRSDALLTRRSMVGLGSARTGTGRSLRIADASGLRVEPNNSQTFRCGRS